MRQYYTYILASKRRTLYVGVTNNLVRRLAQHRQATDSFVSRYMIYNLVYFEATTDVRVAIAREKEIKGWRRKRKKALIESVNPGWLDLSRNWQVFPFNH